MTKYKQIPSNEDSNETIDVLSDTIQNSIKSEVATLSDDQKQEFYDWMCGKMDKMPDFVEGLVNNLAYKINTSMGYLCAISVSRLYKLTQFMSEAEDIIFDPALLRTMSSKEITDVYKTASVTIMQTMEFIRKYLSQNQESINFNSNTSADAVSQVLSTIPPEKLAQLKALFLSQS